MPAVSPPSFDPRRLGISGDSVRTSNPGIQHGPGLRSAANLAPRRSGGRDVLCCVRVFGWRAKAAGGCGAVWKKVRESERASATQNLRPGRRGSPTIARRCGLGEGSDVKAIMPTADPSLIIRLAWEDRTTFEEIEERTGLTEREVIAVMRRELKPSSFRMWRKRVSGRVTKHRKLLRQRLHPRGLEESDL